ncbi:MAG: hypothetical protein A2096_05355 [Spirochaetes bacterium GWF1_41_5]|nr:MAG: hypothetical protein A2096_05355 [Spirochaetes bacterium GWF1_41_5]
MLFSVRKAVAKRAEASRKQHYMLALSDKKYFHRSQRGQWFVVLLQCVSFSSFRVSSGYDDTLENLFVRDNTSL